MKEYVASGDLGRFLGLFSTLINAAFSYGGVEMVAVAAGEAENPRKNIPKAVKRVFWRILFFYVLGTLAIGVLVPSNDPTLLSKKPGAGHSPWVIAIYRAGIPVLPSIINAVILTSASSSANAFLYHRLPLSLRRRPDQAGTPLPPQVLARGCPVLLRHDHRLGLAADLPVARRQRQRRLRLVHEPDDHRAALHVV